MRKPPHDDAVSADDLHPVNAQVLARLVGPASNDQTPGNQGRRVAGPAMLDRQAGQIHVGAFQH